MNSEGYCSVLLGVTLAFVISAVNATLTLETTRELSGPLTNLQFYNDLFYIGGRNKIYAVDKNLDISSSASTCSGSVPNCNNRNKVLVVDSSENKLITCGTGNMGSCEVRPLNNLDSIEKKLSNVVSSDLSRPAQGMMTVNGNFMIAVTFGNDIKSVKGDEHYTYEYAISTRKVPSLVVVIKQSAQKSNLLRVSVPELKEYVIYYKSSFQHGGYSYFLTNQKEFVGRDKYVSKFVRICQNDTSYRSYTDIILTCVNNGITYNLIQNIYFMSHSSETILFATFTNGENPEKAEGESVLCKRNLTDLDEKIMEAKKEYAVDCTDSSVDGKRYLKGLKTKDVKCLAENNFKESDFLCDVIDTLQSYTNVIGNITVTMTASATTSPAEGYVTALNGNEKSSYKPVVMAGTSKGLLIMMNLNPDGSLTRYSKTVVENGVKITAIHQLNDDNLYVTSLNKVYKYSSTNCSEFHTCAETMAGRNPLCGWCVYEGRATRKMNCSDNNHWLSSFTECIKLELTPDGIPVSGDITEVRIDPISIPENRHNDGYECRFKNGAGVLKVTHAMIDGITNQFKCQTPPVDKHTKAVLEFIVASSKITIAEAPFLFYNCSTYEKCAECVSTAGADCSWSMNEPGCKSANTDDIKNVTDCPKLENNMGINFIPRNGAAPVKLQGSNLPNISSTSSTDLKFWCYIPAEKKHFKADISNNEISCDIKIASVEVAKKKDVRVLVKYGKTTAPRKELDDQYRNNVTVYDCGRLADDCSHCKALNKTRYKCYWCSMECLYENENKCDEKCPVPTITGILPRDGPIQGNTKVTIDGTELGTNVSSISSVRIGTTDCELSKDMTDFKISFNKDFDLFVPNCIVCRTGEVLTKQTGQVHVTVNDSKSNGNVNYKYKEVEVTGLHPLHGPASGGTIVTVEGKNLGVGNRIWTVMLGSSNCTNPKVIPTISLSVDYSGNFTIECETGSYSPGQNITQIILTMDGETPYVGNWGPNSYHVLPDPNITDITGSRSGFLSGGTILTVIGSGMKNANKAVVKYTYSGDDVEEECSIESPEKTLCKVPEAPKSLWGDLMRQVNETKESRKKRETSSDWINVTIYVKLDGKQQQFGLRYFRNPSINKFGSEGDILLYGSDERQLILSGGSLNLVATKSDFRVTIGLANCTIIELTEDTLRCSPPSDQPAPVNPKNTFPEVNVNVGNIHVSVGYLQYEKKVETIAIIAGAAAGGLVFIVVIIFVIGFMKYRKVGKKAKAYEKNLSDMEMEIKRVARQEFLDMHTTMSTVNKNLVEQGFPYHGYQQFACNVMFSVDYLWTEPVMTDDERLKANKGMESLESLISNKFFLVSVITTMENEKRFFIREKSNLAGNLCAVLMGRMDYLNEILKLLMTNLVQESSAKKHKTLFRRCESITEKLLSNWLSLCLYPHVKSHSGSPLYLLYMATQKTMESGPIDAVTGDAKYTLSEEKLLKKWSSSVEEDDNHDLKFEAKTLTLNVVVDNGEEIFKCKALDCDTVSQVKSKCLNQIYVNYPASQLPVGADDLALEWHEGFGGALRLRDEDNTSKREGHWVRLNTLAHYNVKDESNMALIDPHSAEINNQEDYVNLANINMEGVCDGSIDSSQPLTPHDEENPHEFEHWHLVKKEEESAKQGKSAIAELYLNRLFTTKQSLMEYMRPLFDLILDHDRCPPPTKFLYDFLDELGEKYKVETDTVHVWKSHSYAIRVWASLMKMPNTLFDVAIPSFMEENLNIISQVFIESFSLASQKFTKDSPSQKLIFHHEMNHYRDRVKEFYKNVKVDSQNSEEFRQYMAEVNRLQQQTNFNKVSALYRFYNQLKPYFEDILENLSKSKEASTLQLDRKLEQVIAIMEEED